MNLVEELRRNCEFSDLIEIPEESKSAFAISMFKAIEPGIGGLWYESGDPQNKYDGNGLAYTFASRYSVLQNFFNVAEIVSPIERRLIGAMTWMRVPGIGFPECDFFGSPKDHFEQFGGFDSPKMFITPQAEIAGYRADFLVWIGAGDMAIGVVVECDGHAYHEKTKEQAARDKRRDREILASGYAVMRFTGSEIFADAHGCAQQVISIVSDIYERAAGASVAKAEA